MAITASTKTVRPGYADSYPAERTKAFIRALLWVCLLDVCFGARAAFGAQNAPPAEVGEAVKLIETRKFTEAMTLLKRLVLAGPRDSNLHFLMGIVLTEQRQLEAANKAFVAARTY